MSQYFLTEFEIAKSLSSSQPVDLCEKPNRTKEFDEKKNPALFAKKNLMAAVT